jgi:hypothetical protein
MEQRHGVSVGVLRPVARALAHVGGDQEGFLDCVGIREETPDVAFVSGERADQALARIAAERRDPALALTLARAAMGQSLGLFEHLVWLSPTLRVALSRTARFYGLVSDRVRISLDDGRMPGPITARS